MTPEHMWLLLFMFNTWAAIGACIIVAGAD
jgi:hypothetical protein